MELRTQGWYFAFQVVQVFLITTFSSGASTVASKFPNRIRGSTTDIFPEQIWDEPTQAPTLLAENLPRAATFYLSFFVLQGIAVTASTIFQIAPFLVFNILAPFVDTTPRKKLERWITLSSLSWGSTYPKFTLFAVIGMWSIIFCLSLSLTRQSDRLLVCCSPRSRLCHVRPFLPLPSIPVQRLLRSDHGC